MESNIAEEELNIPLAAAKIEIPDPVQNAKKPEDSGDSLPKDCDTVNSEEETYLAKSSSKLEEVRTCLSKEEEGELSSEYESADEEVENEEVNNEESLLVDNEEEEEDPVKEALKEEDKNDKEEEEREEDFIDEDYLKEQEASMSEEEKEAKREEAQNIKAEGNNKFKELLYVEAALDYTNALQLCPLCFAKERAIMYSNRAACKLKQGKEESSIKDCSRALELHPHYMKALLRRAELYERTEKLDEALADYQKALEMDPMLPVARAACMRLPDMIKERNEKMKEEMMGKLKDLGNMILKPFGLSTSNFNLQQDPNTGSYSVNFQQGAQQQ